MSQSSMKITLAILIVVSISLGIIIAHRNILQPDQEETCRFAKLYSLEDLESDAKVNEFLAKVIQWETKFIRQVGVHQKTGLTYDGYRLDAKTGQLLPNGLHYWTASSKQSIHMALMAKVLQGKTQIYTPSQVFELVAKKVDTFQAFHKKYPGFGGYFPWVYLRTPQITIPEPTPDFQKRVPSLDNGEMFWAAVSLSQIWQEKYPNQLPSLRERWDNITWRGMIKNMRRIFFNQTTKTIRADAKFQDPLLPPQSNNYYNDIVYFLDDPYEGQLFAWIVTLFGRENNQFSQAEIDGIWVNKRKKLQSAYYVITTLGGVPVTVEKGWWFSAHQQWKNLFLPYYLSPTYKKIQHNNQVARTWHSVDTRIGGMYASVTGFADSNEQNLDYYSDCGIQEICFLKVGHNQTVTPYSTFPLFLIDRKTATKWLHNMIISPAGQTKYGTTEGTSIDGMHASPVLTWDSKITTVLAILNGTTSIVERFLNKKSPVGNKTMLEEFRSRVESQYRRAFGDIRGDDIYIPGPKVTIKKGRDDFTTCK